MIRVGVIGAGKNGAGHCKNLSQKHGDRARIVAVADVNIEAAGALAGQYGAKALDSAEALIDAVDAVVISSPNFLHCEHAVAAAGAGKHVWIEKPMALSVAEADRIVEAVKNAGVASFVGFSVRFDAVARTLTQYYRDGRLGELVSVWSRRLGGSSADPSGTRARGWRGKFATSGGVMSELMAHEIDWMLDITGMPTSVYCRIAGLGSDDPRANDHVWLTFGYNGAATGTIEGSQMSAVPDFAKGIVGSEAGVCSREWGKEAWLCPHGADSEQIPPLERFDKYAHFLDVIEGKCESLADVEHGRTIVRVSEKALESALAGQVVTID